MSKMQYPATNRRPFIIPIFLPHSGCPHQCVFCNQRAITGTSRKNPSPSAIRSQIVEFLKYRGNLRNLVEIAFFGGNFLGLKMDYIKALLSEAATFVQAGQADGIRFCTRPDTIDYRRLEMIKPYPVSTIELGVQSMDDHVLDLVMRGHTSADTKVAVALLKQHNYRIGLQMMVGLPGDSDETAHATVVKISNLQPDFVRIYPTVVLKNSLLAKWYQKGKYLPMSLESCVSLVKNLFLYFRAKNIPVIRMGLQASEDFDKGATIMAGPYHPAFGHLVHSKIFLDMAISAIDARISTDDIVSINVHPRSLSKIKGLKNGNIDFLKKRFKIRHLKIIPDSSMGEDKLSIE
ncbi:MAG: radical SAM protein [Deltaproteobacteria bacterium]|nr:MAG: radical SAM protein [Deltaproteobacteria bacterium]